jgi:hypothetical protein
MATVEQSIEVLEPKALELMEKAAYDVQISTAKRFPRSIGGCIQEAITIVQEDVETAKACMFALPRGGKTIKGKSVRLAEVLQYAWGNIRTGARLLNIGDTFVEVVGFCHDLEKNTRTEVTVSRRCTYSNDVKDKYGNVKFKAGDRYNDDMLTMTINAAASIARRNAIFQVIPAVYANRVYEEAIETALGKQKPMEERRDAAISHFAKLGIKKEQILGYIGRARVEDLDRDDLETLHGLANAIKEGEVDINEIIAQPEARTRAEIDPSKISSGTPPEDPKASAESSPQPIDERAELITKVKALLADLPANEVRDEMIRAARIESGTREKDWTKWETTAIQTLEAALTKE